MAQEPLVECAFFVPLRRDAILADGELHSSEMWEWLDDELYAQFGGRTVAPGFYEGFYSDPDTHQKVTDKSRKYIVAVQREATDQLRSLLGKACGMFQQKCMYLSIAGQVEFVGAENHEKGKELS